QKQHHCQDKAPHRSRSERRCDPTNAPRWMKGAMAVGNAAQSLRRHLDFAYWKDCNHRRPARADASLLTGFVLIAFATLY
ncbi:MAG: hypothetical protein KGI68_03155, partial [Alphaproteobacteria bacterium]|nr:hypothetical protein [Alphaproteobacteria bacterium]